MENNNEKNLDYDERIRLHNEIINSTNGTVYKNNNSINVVNDNNKSIKNNKISNTSDKKDIKKKVDNKNTEVNNKNNKVNNNESGGVTNPIVKFIMLIFKVAFFFFLSYVVLIAIAFGVCIFIMVGATL